MPFELPDALVVVLLDIFLAFVLIVEEHHTFEESVGECEFAHSVLGILAHVDEELVVAVCLKLRLETLGYPGAELFLALHCVLAEHVVEHLLVHLSLLEAAYLYHLIAEIGIHRLHSLAVYLEQACHFGVVVRISLARVEGDDVARFCVVEQLLLVFHLNIFGHHHGSVHRYSAFLCVAVGVQLTQVALQHVALLAVVRVCLLIASQLTCEHIHLLVDELVVRLDVVVSELGVAVELYLELRSHSYVEHESVRSVLLYVHRLLLFRRKGLSEHLYLVVLYISINLLSHELVKSVHLHRCAELLFNKSHRHHTRTEAREVRFLTVVFQSLLYIVLEICFFDSDGHETVYFVGILK